MPFRNRGLDMFMNWEPGDNFDIATDRLLLETTWGQLLVLRAAREEGDGSRLVLDPDFLPQQIAEIPKKLESIHGFQPRDEWWVYLFDGDLTVSGPKIDIHVVGAGWSWDIHTSLGITKITPVKLADIDRSKITTDLDGIYIKAPRSTIHNRDYDRRHDSVTV